MNTPFMFQKNPRCFKNCKIFTLIVHKLGRVLRERIRVFSLPSGKKLYAQFTNNKDKF